MTAKRKSTRKRSKSKPTASRRKPGKKKQPAKKLNPRAKVSKAKGARKSAGKKTAKSSSGARRAAATRLQGSGLGPSYAGQSGDLQGLSALEHSDSESVDELLEEGNAFEAGVVHGVEAAEDADEREVHTHEVPEDDVPEEYLDKDS